MHQEMDELRTKYVGLFDEMSTELKGWFHLSLLPLFAAALSPGIPALRADPFKKSRSAYVIASSSSSRVADPTAKSQRPSSSSTGSRAFARLDEARTVSQVLYAGDSLSLFSFLLCCHACVYPRDF